MGCDIDFPKSMISRFRVQLQSTFFPDQIYATNFSEMSKTHFGRHLGQKSAKPTLLPVCTSGLPSQLIRLCYSRAGHNPLARPWGSARLAFYGRRGNPPFLSLLCVNKNPSQFIRCFLLPEYCSCVAKK